MRSETRYGPTTVSRRATFRAAGKRPGCTDKKLRPPPTKGRACRVSRPRAIAIFRPENLATNLSFSTNPRNLTWVCSEISTLAQNAYLIYWRVRVGVLLIGVRQASRPFPSVSKRTALNGRLLRKNAEPDSLSTASYDAREISGKELASLLGGFRFVCEFRCRDRFDHSADRGLRISEELNDF